jgi:hypothetical protein
LALPEQLWLAAVVAGEPATDLLPNGGFESGPAVWATGSAQQRATIVPAGDLPAGVTPRTGGWAAWLGNADGETGYLEQTVVVIAQSPILSYWQRISSAESRCHYDYVSIWVEGDVVDAYGLCTASNTTVWAQHRVDLSDFAGRTVVVRIQVTTDGSISSNLYLDDMGFQPAP